MQKMKTSTPGLIRSPVQKLAATDGPSYNYPENAGRYKLNGGRSVGGLKVLTAESRADVGPAQLRSCMIERFVDVIKRPALECVVPPLGVASE